MPVFLKCNCGKSAMTFKRLRKEDFAEGWNHDCCFEAAKLKATEEKKPEELSTTTEEPVVVKKKGGRPKRVDNE